jgi:hypothetical protein
MIISKTGDVTQAQQAVVLSGWVAAKKAASKDVPGTGEIRVEPLFAKIKGKIDEATKNVEKAVALAFAGEQSEWEMKTAKTILADVKSELRLLMEKAPNVALKQSFFIALGSLTRLTQQFADIKQALAPKNPALHGAAQLFKVYAELFLRDVKKIVLPK